MSPSGRSLRRQRARLEHLRDDFAAAGRGIGENGGAEPARRGWQDARQHGLGRGAQQRAQLRGAVDVEQDQLAAVLGQVHVERRDDRARGHREVHHRLEREDGRQPVDASVACVDGDALLQCHRQAMRLPRGVDRETSCT